METCFNYCDKEHGYFSSDERKFISKVRKLKEKYPDDVRIIKEPEDNDGCIYCELPTEWFSIRPPKKMNFTAEQKEASRVRIMKMHEHRQNNIVSAEKTGHLPVSNVEDE